MTKTLTLMAGTALASLMFAGSANAVQITGSSGGVFHSLNNCDNSGGNQDCRIVNTVANGPNTQVQWGSTNSSINFINPSTLTSVDLNISGNTNTSLRIGQLQWFNSPTIGNETPDNFSVLWNFSVNFSSPAGSADPNGTETFSLNIINPTNPPGDTIGGLTLAELGNISLTLTDVIISNFRYEVEDLNGNSSAAGCSGDDTSYNPATGKWSNCEGNLANLYIVADFTSRTAVPEPTALALFGAGLAGLGLIARRRRSA